MSNTQLHVLFLPKWYPHEFDPFDGNFVENHAHAIKQFAQITVLFVHSDNSSDKKFRMESNENQGIYELRVFFKKYSSGISFLDKLINALRYFMAQKLGYQELLKQGKNFDITHVHVLRRSAMLALLLKHKFDIPFGITEHWSGYLPENGFYKGFIMKLSSKIISKRASFINTVSSQLKSAMLSHNLRGEYKVIPNVVDTELFTIGTRNQTMTEVLFVGNLLQSPKRVFDILSVFIRILNKRQDFVLNIYGEGKDEETCKEMIKESGLGDFIKLKGTASRAKIAEEMGKSAFLFLFSEFENQPCVINEAQACGLPVVVPDIPGIMEHMNQDLGMVYPRGNEQEFEKSILEMLDQFPRYDRNIIRQFAIENFSEEVIGKQFRELYHQSVHPK